MRTLLFLGLAIGAAFMANWFTVERAGDRTRIDINRDEIRSDAQHAIDKGREILDKREGQAYVPPAAGYGPAEGYGPAQSSVPAQSSWPTSGPVQNTGYAGQDAYGNPPAYSGQTYGGQNYQGRPASGQPASGQTYGAQPYGAQPYENQAPPSGYGPTYPASAGNPPPWQR